MANPAAKRSRTWALGFWACGVEGGFSTVLEEIDGVLETIGSSTPSSPIARLPDDRHRTHDVLEWQGKAVRFVSLAGHGRLELTRCMFELMDRLKKHYPSSFPDMALLGMVCEISSPPSPGEGLITTTASVALWIPKTKESLILFQAPLATTREVQDVVAVSPVFVFNHLAAGNNDEFLRPFLGRAAARARCYPLDKNLSSCPSGGMARPGPGAGAEAGAQSPGLDGGAGAGVGRLPGAAFRGPGPGGALASGGRSPAGACVSGPG